MIRPIFSCLFGFLALTTLAQTDSLFVEKDRLDSTYIDSVEGKEGPLKLLHAEPLYIDLIRDLGARRGEKEWNVGLGLTDQSRFDEYEALVEYEWAPLDRLGLEVELPFTIFSPINGELPRDSIPGNKLNAFKFAAQYTVLVDGRSKTSIAVGYLHEFELAPFRDWENGSRFDGNLFNPFMVVAKRWGQNYHSLIYAGPQIFKGLGQSSIETNWQINTSLHYMIDGTRNFVGIEVNKDLTSDDFQLTLRPQMRVGLADDLMVGIVSGVPIMNDGERLSVFLRLIYEPGHRHR